MVKTATKGKVFWRLGFAILVGSLSLTIGGCSNDGDPAKTTDLSPTEQVDLGWSHFEDGEYASALQEFEGALGRNGNLSDAWNGKGWALGKLPNRLDEAPACFAKALQIDTTRYDAIGGWAFAAYQIGNWSSAVNKSDSLLHRRPGWRFLHEVTLNEKDLQLVIAASHFNLGDYSSSYATIIDHLNPLFEADINTPAGRLELLDEIERLRRVNG